PFNLKFLHFLRTVVGEMEDITFQNDFSAATILQHAFKLIQEENRSRGRVGAGRRASSLLSDLK
ncbi:MAG: hypothetical protein ACXU9U_03245, partial [Parachlamydiaceae bacterium]